MKNDNIFGKAYASEAGKTGAPIAKYHKRHVLFGRRNAYLELYPGYEGTLDTLVVCVVFITLPTLRYLSVTSNIVTFLYVEWKRRQSQSSGTVSG